ncbi:MAG TPA: DUF2332 domain-containing protein [Gaiellaceae bacterium]|nr:DUF2332 domain-containing protein [Gaiellaceae bacterium]
MLEGRDRARPQGSRRPRRQRPRRVRRDRRAGQGRAAGVARLNRREAFELQARHFSRESPLYERLALELVDEPLLPDEVDWRYPLQLFAGLHYLVLAGRAAWDDVGAALRDEAAFLREWVATERVQTNEPRRCWWLVPCFLEAARCRGAAAFDCVELGCSAGLNLLWDRYGYEYDAGSLDGFPVFGGEERGRAVPLSPPPQVRSRVGVDLAPPDLHTDEGVRLLKAFVWAGQEQRLADLEAAVEVWRRDPPEIVAGDLVDGLPALLERGGDDTVLLVWETAAFGYLPPERREQARALLAAADCVFVHTGRPEDGSHDYYGLYVDDDEVAHAEFHGAWIEWLA